MFCRPSSGDFGVDEQIAARGLSVKLDPEQTPDLQACTEALEGIVQAFAPTADIVSRSFVALRCVRGAAGILWAGRACVQLGDAFRTHMRHEEGREALRWLAGQLLQMDPHPERARWLSHSEGRHAALSGRGALKALRHAPDTAAEAAVLLEPVVQAILARGVGEEVGPLSNACLLQALTACERRLPLALRRLRARARRAGARAAGGQAPAGGARARRASARAAGGQGPARGARELVAWVAVRSGSYNAANAGWMLLGWAWQTQRATFRMSREALECIKAAQAEHAQAALADITTPAEFEAKRARLGAHAGNTLAVPVPGTSRRGLPRAGLFPGMVFVHACETAQVAKHVAGSDIQLVLRADLERVRAAARERLAAEVASEMAQKATHRVTCMTHVVFEAVVQAVSAAAAAGSEAPTRGLRLKGRAPPEAARGEAPAAPAANKTARRRAGRAAARQPALRKRAWRRPAGRAAASRAATEKKGRTAAAAQPAAREARTAGGEAPARVPASDGRRKRGAPKGGLHKIMVACDVCGRSVRKDVIARHKASAICVRP